MTWLWCKVVLGGPTVVTEEELDCEQELLASAFFCIFARLFGDPIISLNSGAPATADPGGER